MADPPANATVTTTATATAVPGEKPLVSISTLVQEGLPPVDNLLDSPGASAPAAKRAKTLDSAEGAQGGDAPLVASSAPAHPATAGPTVGSDAPGAPAQNPFQHCTLRY